MLHKLSSRLIWLRRLVGRIKGLVFQGTSYYACQEKNYET